MNDNELKRELYWWEHYPLHKLWCSDYCPLVPRFEYRKGDEWNANGWSLHWLIFKVWTLEHFTFNLEFNLSPESITIGIMFPYLRILIGFHHVLGRTWLYEICHALRRKPAEKNHSGEYN
jgi:hypothetical protein